MNELKIFKNEEFGSIRTVEIEGDTVIDPCAGSGSTLQAAYELGRNSYGFEISTKFYTDAKKKMPCLQKGDDKVATI
mgnify:CR=1 FL=1